MFDFLISLKRMLFPSDASQLDWESNRSRSLLLGVPAVVAIILAIILLGLSQIGQQGRLVAWYSSILEVAEDDYQSKISVLSTQRNIAASTRDPEKKKEQESVIETLTQEANLLKEKQQIYLAKLIDLDPGNPEYKFDLAMSHRDSDKNKQIAQMMALAPESEPVYYQAHSFMALHHFRESAKAKNYGDKKKLLEKALIQADRCLIQQADDQNAKMIKAKVLQEFGKFGDAQELYKELFEVEVGFFRDWALVTKELGEDNTSIFRSAIDKYEEARRLNTNDDTKIWVNCLENLVRCRILLKEFQVAIDSLKEELQSQKSNPVRRKFLRDQLSYVYANWATEDEMLTATPEQRNRAFERISQAYKYNPQNPGALKLLGWIVANDQNLSKQAKAIYDPYLDPNPPADVLSELGTRSLQLKEYDRAISLFRKARIKNANDPIVLNNLAYTLLVSQNTDESAKEALTLVEDGMRILSNSKDPGLYATYLLATRGEAQKQLGQMEDAIANFEKAMHSRPENQRIDLVEALIECYDGLIDEQADVYREYLKQLRSKYKQNASTN